MLRSAALRQGSFVVEGVSHRDCAGVLPFVSGYSQEPVQQGFVTTTGVFRTRQQAALLALRTGQAKQVALPEHGLHSSDLDPRQFPIFADANLGTF